MKRREFILGGGALSLLGGCVGSNALSFGTGGCMAGFRTAPMSRIRVGFAGMGGRGTSAMYRIAQIPGCVVTGICDLRQNRLDVCNGWLKKNGYAAAKEYLGAEAYKRMCEAEDVDVVYVTTGFQMHAPIGIYAVNRGRHAFVEVPAAMTVDDCWAFVEGAEKNRVHAMMLENCCYGEEELLALNLCRLGMLGELVHGEAGYIHDLRFSCYADAEGEPGDPKRGYWEHWRLDWNSAHKGNQYPTHGLGPVCQYMNINRGDRMDYLCSVESGQFNFEAYAKAAFPAGDWHERRKVEMGDMNTTLVRTVKGRSIMIQHDISSPRPYSRLNLISGTKGILKGFPFEVGFNDTPGRHVSFFNEKRKREVREKFRHPYFSAAGEIARKIGGHGGMDFLMDLRWIYCLQNGLPMDMDVYDLATWSSICELSERSVRTRRYVDVPDFTRGGWKSAAPLGIVTVDMDKFDFRGVASSTVQMEI